MSSVAVEPRYTPEQYLAQERQAPYKSEYFNGRIYAMAGASREHNLISFNFARELGNQMRNRDCETYVADMRVKSRATTAYLYPDVAVVCGQPQFEDTGLDTLLNPTVLVEVLSPSTEAGDRGHKFAHYRRIPSLQEYVLVAQDRVLVERHVRQENGWLLTEFNDLEATLPLAAIGCEVALRDIYARVTFPPAEAPTDGA
jgi:Uma2 family endonuclease